MFYLKLLHIFPNDDENTIRLWVTALLNGTNTFKQLGLDYSYSNSSFNLNSTQNA